MAPQARAAARFASLSRGKPRLRRSASQAWFEFMPAEISFSLEAGLGVGNIRIYRDLKFGKLMHLVN